MMTRVFVVAAALAIAMVGCASHEQLAPLEPAASVTLQGDPIVRQAPGSGQLSVLDVNQQKVVFSGYVKKDEVVTLNPQSNRLTIGDEIGAENLRGGDEFQVAFSAAP